VVRHALRHEGLVEHERGARETGLDIAIGPLGRGAPVGSWPSPAAAKSCAVHLISLTSPCAG
jgi:hypothetical protein